MNDLPEVYQLLAAGLHADPLLCLAQAVACFDPFRVESDEDDFDDDGLLSEALRITRDGFPDIYAQAVDALHHGADYDDLYRLICTEISRQGIPLDSLEEMDYGVPMPAYGAALYDLDFYTQHPDVVPVLAMFGIQPDEDAYRMDVPNRAYAAGHRLYDSLVKHPDPRYQQVGWLMGWLFACTGNSIVDLDFESLAEIQPLSWEPDEFAFAVEIIREADEIMTAAQAGLELVQSNPRNQQALQGNIQRIYRISVREKGKEYTDTPVRLRWPGIA